jgi:prepilin-type N-terminal cleavage/methylation domain-containing protein
MRLRYFNTLLTLRKDSRGFTLVELLVALSIAGLLVSAASVTLNQLFSLVPAGENMMVAIRQVQDAGYWISTDGLQAQVITPGASSGMPLTISWVKWDATKTTVTFSLTNGNLQRQEVVTYESTGNVKSSKQTQVAYSITSITAQYNQPDANNPRKILTITITAQIGSSNETRTYKISPRSL